MRSSKETRIITLSEGETCRGSISRFIVASREEMRYKGRSRWRHHDAGAYSFCAW